MRKTVLAAIGLACFGLGLAAAHAQDLQMAGTTAAPSRAGLPDRGMTMAQVEKRLGAPSERIAPVGQPPISRWVYPSCVVFFEHNLVIHAVARSPAQPAR